MAVSQTVHQQTESNHMAHEITGLVGDALVLSRRAGKIKSIHINNTRGNSAPNSLSQILHLYDKATGATPASDNPDWSFSVHDDTIDQTVTFPDSDIAAFSNGLQCAALASEAVTNEGILSVPADAASFNVTIVIEEDS